MEADERINPSEIPADPWRFDAWSRYACVEWPSELTIAACLASNALNKKPMSDDADIERFSQMYSDWWNKPEETKWSLMDTHQRESGNRDRYRRKATEAAIAPRL